MRRLLKTRFGLVLGFLWLATRAYGQAVAPTGATENTVVSFGLNLNIPIGDGTVHYDATASEMLEQGLSGTGSGNGWYSIATVGGDVSYISKSTAQPFSLLYSGGYFWSTVPGYPSTTYQNLTVSQGIVRRAWTAAISDNFSYLPLSPAFGISGIPGTGDLGTQTIQTGSGPAPTLLTNFTTILMNTITGDVNRSITNNTYVSGSASWGVMRFLGSPGLNNTEVTETLGLNRRLDTRNTVGVDYVYSNFTYQNLNGFAFTTQGVNLTDLRQWSRSLSMTASIGPQWISSSDKAAFPPQTDLAANINFNYTKKFRTASVGYSRGAMSGVGVLPGAFEDSFQASIEQTWGRNWMAALTGSYIRATGFGTGNYGSYGSYLGSSRSGSAILASSGALDGEYGGVQVTRKLGRSFSTYASYTAENQSVGQSLTAQNALSGFSQFIAVGVTYAPRSLRLGQL
ncbi:MAG: hypothetical protein ACYDC6_04535 [Acidobacteriaceae bacterium]